MPYISTPTSSEMGAPSWPVLQETSIDYLASKGIEHTDLRPANWKSVTPSRVPSLKRFIGDDQLPGRLPILIDLGHVNRFTPTPESRSQKIQAGVDWIQQLDSSHFKKNSVARKFYGTFGSPSGHQPEKSKSNICKVFAWVVWVPEFTGWGVDPFLLNL
ncbi:hypothetical protein PROFUN_12650 [Planoprotostelium fungivorum]|uniref:Uncharacterized protein n=1 Tax=Planoprotostelium fungivorum TaxID=1890364 RepID=A0A2P6N6X8_9EUKA|nr:hypothetical protein PROFUN_12650 [Planoprotostelium fungivorum]